MRFALRLLRAVPRALEIGYLRWALREMGSLHPDVPEVVLRLHELES
jgi:hypothetical protein